MSEETEPREPTGDDETPRDDKKQVTMTQDALDALFKERVDRAKKSAVNGVVTEMGFEDIDGLKEALADWKKAKDAQKSELEKLQENLEASKTRVSELEVELALEKDRAETYMLRSSVVTAARDADFLKESLDDVWLLVNSTEDLFNGLKVDGETVKGAAEVVKKVAELRPHWIEQKQRPGTPPPRTSTPGQPSGTPTSDQREQPLVRF